MPRSYQKPKLPHQDPRVSNICVNQPRTVGYNAIYRGKGDLCRYQKAVLSQRWPRDACYLSRSWAVAEIWPFKIIQDGGGRHLEFVRIENSAIRSAVPENPTLKNPITKHEVDRITRCKDIAIRVYWGHLEPPFWGEGEVVGGQRWQH